VEKNIDLVTDMHPDELRLAIEQPAAQHGVVFQQGLVEEIIKDVQGQAGSLPLLQYTLSLLWEKEQKEDGLADRTLNTKSYRELHGVRGALQKRADQIYASFGNGSDPKSPSEKQESVRKIFLRLVDIATVNGTGDAAWRPMRRRVPIASFQGAGEEQVLEKLITQRLLVTNRERADLAHSGNGPPAPETAGEVAHHREENVAPPKPIVEVAHEALFTCWDRLRDWITDAKHVIFVKNRLVDDCRRWKLLHESGAAGADDELWHGSRLQEALECRNRQFF
jgi:hypothetical protein